MAFSQGFLLQVSPFVVLMLMALLLLPSMPLQLVGARSTGSGSYSGSSTQSIIKVIGNIILIKDYHPKK